MFVFSLIAPFVLPVINQVKVELNTGSSEIIQSSKDKQLIVFHDDYSSDPTHSMLSKDHFSNVLNEPAGKVASQVLKWVVPQLIACWDDERIDVDRTLTRIINGVFHHPNLRDFGQDGAVDGRRLMFGVVQQWWGSKDEQECEVLRDQLSRDGVEQGRNHKEGVHDTGHGCGKPLGMPTSKTASSSGAIGGLAGGAILGDISSALAGESQYDAGYTGGGGHSSGGDSSGLGKLAGEAVGGGAVGGIIGGLVGGIGGDLLGDAFGGSESKKKTYQSQKFDEDGSYTQSVTETGYNPQQGGGRSAYGQAEYSQTSFPGGGQRQEYQRYQQEESGRTGYGEQVIRESRPTYGGGFEQTTETRYETEDRWQSQVRREGRDSSGQMYSNVDEYQGGGGSRKDSDSDSDSSKKKKKKHHKKHDSDSDDDESKKYGRQSGGYGEQQGYGESRQEFGSAGYGSQGYGESRQESGSGGYGSQGYGGENRFQEQRSENQSGGGYGGGNRDESERPAYGGSGGYGGMPGGFGGEEESSEREQFSERSEYAREERFGEEREEESRGYEERSYNQGDGGYGQGGDYQERRGYGDGY